MKNEPQGLPIKSRVGRGDEGSIRDLTELCNSECPFFREHHGFQYCGASNGFRILWPNNKIPKTCSFKSRNIHVKTSIPYLDAQIELNSQAY